MIPRLADMRKFLQFLHFPASCFLLAVFLFTLNAQAQKAELRTFTNIQGVQFTARLKAVARNKATVELENGRDYTASISSFSALDQSYIKQWSVYHPDSMIPAPVKSGIKLERINALIGHELFIDGNLWENPTLQTANH